ncbi:MAG: hydantoinase B/oxoprolinase family protein [Bacteroidota bacterium]
MDPVLLTLYEHRFAGVSEEMGVTLQRTSYSPNIKERLDFSCAVFDEAGSMVAQAAHIPVHLGAMPASVEAALQTFPDWQPGDVVMLNDPYQGGTHLPDVTLVSPVFVDGQRDRPKFFIASRAHHADIGGMTPGSLPLSTEIYQEGLIIPPVRLYTAGQLNADLLRLVLRNVRTPEERKGDLSAQRAAHAVGARRLQELATRYGIEEVQAYAGHVQAYSKKLVHAAISQWPDGVYRYTDYLELDAEEPASRVPVVLCVTIDGGSITFDFEGTGAADQSSLNAVLSITQSACYYVVISLAGEEIPVNSGCFSAVHVKAPNGCVVNATPPAAVAGGNVETSQRIVDTAFGALAQALPNQVPAGSQGTMNNLTIGGQLADGRPFAYYETIAGGMGATAYADGLDGVHVHMSNTLNTPVEALEMAFPFRLNTYTLRKDGAGGGRQRGGRGVVREYLFLRDVTATMLSERRAIAPVGLAGGESGSSGVNTLVKANGEQITLPSKFSRRFKEGECLRIETPGGGGWGV